MPVPRGTSLPQDFDLLAHLEVKELAEGEVEEEAEDVAPDEEGDEP
jgi:hypothetical protein